mmetsp:Transcript_30738/g.87755  ORF Transcript_30738/g.87755 Transcript_30738/m.87755 type:complete len:138 (+) Transcript_30738:57-470(+)
MNHQSGSTSLVLDFKILFRMWVKYIAEGARDENDERFREENDHRRAIGRQMWMVSIIGPPLRRKCQPRRQRMRNTTRKNLPSRIILATMKFSIKLPLAEACIIYLLQQRLRISRPQWVPWKKNHRRPPGCITTTITI